MADDKLNLEIERVLSYMKQFDPDTQEYQDSVQALRILYDVRSRPRAFIIDPNTLATGLFGILNVLLIMNHERLHVISTRAFGVVKFK